MRSRWILLLEAGAAVLFLGLLALLAARVVRSSPDPGDVPWLLLAAAAGYALADVASGLTHWFCDTFFEETTPGIGPVLIHPFRQHHRDPAAMTRHGFLELTGNSCLGVAPVMGLALWRSWSEILDAGVIAFALALFATNLFHKWAHSERVPRPVAWLQKCRLILNPSQHAVHHAPPNTSAYCVTNGWMNPLMDRILGRKESIVPAVPAERLTTWEESNGLILPPRPVSARERTENIQSRAGRAPERGPAAGRPSP
jgi:ubiquitin-conjugating enzyme E2 variant